MPGSNCPHYDGEADRRPAYHSLVQAGLPDGYAADDDAGLHFINGVQQQVVSSRPQARGYRVELHGNDVVEIELPIQILGN